MSGQGLNSQKVVDPILRSFGRMVYNDKRKAKFLLLLLHRTQAVNSCGHPQSKHASLNTTYLLTLGVDFCLNGPFLSHHKGNHTPTSGRLPGFEP